MASHPTHAPPGTLLIAGIAQLLTAERRKKNPDAPAYAIATVLSWVKESRKPGGRYFDNPVPKEAGYLGSSRQVIWWREEQAPDWIRWYHSRPGYGHGTGGRYAGRKAAVAQPPKRRKGTGRQPATS